MVLSKKRKTGVGQFLDLDAEEDSGESEVENEFDYDEDDDDENEPLLDKKAAVFDAPEDEQGWYRDALCEYLTSRYVAKSSAGTHTDISNSGSLPSTASAGPSFQAGTSSLQVSQNSEPSSSRKSPVSPTDAGSYPRASQNTTETRFHEHLMYSDSRSNAAPLRISLPAHAKHQLLDADLNLPNPRLQELKEKKKYLSDDHLGHLVWVSVRSGTYRGDIGLAIGIEKNAEEQQRDEEELERRNENPGELSELFGFQERFPWTLERSRYKHDTFNVLLVPRLRVPKRKRPDNESSSPRRHLPILFNRRDYSGVTRAPDFKYEVEEKNYWGDVVELVEETRESFLYKDQIFVDGLLLAEYPRSSLKLATTTPAALEKPLTSTLHPLVRRCPLPHPEPWSFEDGEEVTWAKRGTVAENRNGTFLALVSSGRGSEPQTALISFPDGVFPAKTRELLKPLRLGDWVLLRKGKYQGRQGCIVGKRETSIEILLPEQKIFVSVHINSAKRY
ncbi:hypothetical protein V5O48_018922, partial [Marasmius crinis-equi]